MHFLRRFFGADPAGLVEPEDLATRHSGLQADAAVAARGLDIEAAIEAHRRWRQRLRAQLLPQEHDPDGAAGLPLQREQACRDDNCPLGQWIHGRGRARLGTFPGFTALQAHHRMFHHVAGNVLALEEAGKGADARRMLDDQFEDYAGRVAADLRLLRQVVGEVDASR